MTQPSANNLASCNPAAQPTPPLLQPSKPYVIIGIGSYHGDDRAGWEVVDRLQRRIGPPAKFHKAAVPHDLLDWLEYTTETHIIDGCVDSDYSLRRFSLSLDTHGELQTRSSLGATSGIPVAPRAADICVPPLRSGSTHQFNLMSTLRLAGQLDRLPQQLSLWTVPVWSVDKNGELSENAAACVNACVGQLTLELCSV